MIPALAWIATVLLAALALAVADDLRQRHLLRAARLQADALRGRLAYLRVQLLALGPTAPDTDPGEP